MKRLLIAMVLLCGGVISGQEVLDRVLARVNGEPITLSDARVAIALGLVQPSPGDDPVAAALRYLIERRLVLAEVARFAPPEPDPKMLQGEVNALEARAGGAAKLAALENTTGVGEAQRREIVRDTLRIQAYLNQRFGSSVQVSEDDVAQYYRTHQEEFTTGGRLQPFEEAQPAARQRAAAERRRTVIERWLRDLRARADVVELYKQ